MTCGANLLQEFSQWGHYLDIPKIFPMWYIDNIPNAKTPWVDQNVALLILFSDVSFQKASVMIINHFRKTDIHYQNKPVSKHVELSGCHKVISYKKIFNINMQKTQNINLYVCKKFIWCSLNIVEHCFRDHKFSAMDMVLFICSSEQPFL